MSQNNIPHKSLFIVIHIMPWIKFKSSHKLKSKHVSDRAGSTIQTRVVFNLEFRV